MKDKPILFNTAMVRALLDGSKTQTRRVVKPQSDKIYEGTSFADSRVILFPTERTNEFGTMIGGSIECPYGNPGDLLWVREAFQEVIISQIGAEEKETDIAYMATPANFPGPWKPSIHMPRWASRLTLRITDVRVERVQDISETDATAEGINILHDGEFGEVYQGILNHSPISPTAKKAFEDLWDSINDKTGFGWDQNPWVWVVEFEVINQNVDGFIAGSSVYAGIAV